MAAFSVFLDNQEDNYRAQPSAWRVVDPGDQSGPDVLTAFVVSVGVECNAEMELQTAEDTTAGPIRPVGERDAYAAEAQAPT